MNAELDYGLLDPRLLSSNKGGQLHTGERLRQAGTLPEIVAYNKMLQRIELGEKKFDDYPHEAYILASELLSCEERSVGIREFTARLHLLGNHYENGRGYFLSPDKTKNPGREAESITYAIVRSIDMDPGKTYAYLPHMNSAAFKAADALYTDEEARALAQKNVLYVTEKVKSLWVEESNLIPFPEEATIYSARAAD